MQRVPNRPEYSYSLRAYFILCIPLREKNITQVSKECQIKKSSVKLQIPPPNKYFCPQ
jgi:hypothetical protein